MARPGMLAGKLLTVMQSALFLFMRYNILKHLPNATPPRNKFLHMCMITLCLLVSSADTLCKLFDTLMVFPEIVDFEDDRTVGRVKTIDFAPINTESYITLISYNQEQELDIGSI